MFRVRDSRDYLSVPVREGNKWVFPSGRTVPVVAGGDPTATEGEVEGGVTITVPAEQKQETSSEQTFTAEQIAEARRQEKEKLYPEIETLKERNARLQEQMEAFNADLEERRAAEAAAAEAAEAERRAREAEELSAKELLEQREAEWAERFQEQDSKYAQQFEELQQRAAAQEALLERERAFQALESYKNARISEYGEQIMPELLDLVGGDSEAAIDASISAAIDKTSAIMASVEAQLAQQRGPRGVPATGASPTGPMEEQSSQRTLTPDDIRNMSMDEYAQHRAALLSQARPR